MPRAAAYAAICRHADASDAAIVSPSLSPPLMPPPDFRF